MSHGFAFGAGFVGGWLARSAMGSTRETIVRGIALAMKVRDRMRRAAADQVEWWEDMVAEADIRRADEEKDSRMGRPPVGSPMCVVPTDSTVC